MKHSVLILLSLIFSISLKGQKADMKLAKSAIKQGHIIKAIDIIDAGVDKSDKKSASKYYKILSKIHKKKISKNFFKVDKEIEIVNRLSEVIVKLDSRYHKDDVFKEYSYIRNTLNLNYCNLWKYKCTNNEFTTAIKYFKRAILLYNLTAKYGGIENAPKLSVTRNLYADKLKNELDDLESDIAVAEAEPGKYIKGLDGKTTYLPSMASLKPKLEYIKKSKELRNARELGTNVSIDIPLNKKVRIFIEQELVNAGDISLRNQDTLSAKFFYNISIKKNIKPSIEAYSFLLKNAKSKEESLYYSKKLISDALNSDIKYFVTFCSLNEEKSLLPILDIVHSYEKQNDVYSLLKGVLLLYINNLEESEQTFNGIIEKNKQSTVILSSIGRAYLQYAASNTAREDSPLSEKLELFNKALFYLNKAKKINNSNSINSSIDLCNNYIMILNNKRNSTH